MAGTKYAYVKAFERPDPLLPNTFIVCRVDGRAFHRFTEAHGFDKPNDVHGLCLMERAARVVMDECKDIVLAFGESDEFSFLLRRSTQLYKRRESKILTILVSHFTSAYIFYWAEYFPNTRQLYPPTFDGRIVLYPTEREVRDYFSWRQADTHINNLYNTTFWALIRQGRQTTAEAHATLRGTISSQKHEILYSRFGINYNNLDARFRKGSVLVREAVEVGTIAEATPQEDASPPETDVSRSDAQRPAEDVPSGDPKAERRSPKKGPKLEVRVLHEDIIGDDFWERRPMILNET